MQRLVQQCRALGDQACLLAAVAAQVACLVGDEALAAVTPADLTEVALGEGLLAIVVAQLAVGVGHDLASAGVVAEQRAAGEILRHAVAEVVEDRGGQVDMAVDAALDRRQGRLLRRQHQVETPGRGEANLVDAVGLVRGDDDQGVLQHALFLQSAEEGVHRVIQVGDRGLLRIRIAHQVFGRRGVGLVGADREQGEHPGLLLLAQLLDVGQRTFEEGLVVHAPGEFQVGLVAEPVAPQGLVEAHLRHDLVLGHEAQPGTLQEVGAEAVLVQLRRQAGLGAGRVVQQFQALGRARVQLAVVAAEHGVEAADGLVAVQHVVRRGHRAFGPAAELGHQRVLVAAVDRRAVGGDVGAGNAFQGDHQHVARAAGAGEQRSAVEVQACQAGDVRRGVGLVAVEPVLGRQLAAVDGAGHHLVRQVELLPLVGVAGMHVLQGGMAHQQCGRGGEPLPGQRPVPASPAGQAGQQAGTECEAHVGMGDAAALGGVADELRVEQILQVARLGHPADGADQLGVAQHHQAPEQHQRQRQEQRAAVEQEHQEAAEGEVGQVAEEV
ncbi:hypothetical protein D3C80_577900 [compost metagenome]